MTPFRFQTAQKNSASLYNLTMHAFLCFNCLLHSIEYSFLEARQICLVNCFVPRNLNEIGPGLGILSRRQAMY